MTDLQPVFEKSREAARALNLESGERIAATLHKVADELLREKAAILHANRQDLLRMERNNPLYDRLLLNSERLNSIAAEMHAVADMPSPVGRILHRTTRPNGLKIEKVSVPFGVVGVIFEARPNVCCDVFALCFKSANASLLKGSRSATLSNTAITDIIRRVLREEEMDENIVTLLPEEREATDALMGAVEYVDLIIPRGGASLINFVRANSRVPVIETGAGICHTYFDRMGDAGKGSAIIFNAKTRRVSVCNTLDCLIVHSERLGDLPKLCGGLAEKNVVIYADPRAREALAGHYPEELLLPARPKNFGTEFLDYKMAVKSVDSLPEALAHIARYGSRHSEAIITEDRAAAALFTRSVDAACVYTNASTAFSDGAQFGLGAEIGISTQKLHARGPMGLEELTTYKYVVTGNGQVRQG